MIMLMIMHSWEQEKKSSSSRDIIDTDIFWQLSQN